MLLLVGCGSKEKEVFDVYRCDYKDEIAVNEKTVKHEIGDPDTIVFNEKILKYDVSYQIWVTLDHKSVHFSLVNTVIHFSSMQEAKEAIEVLQRLGLSVHFVNNTDVVISQTNVSNYGLLNSSDIDNWINERIEEDGWKCSLSEKVHDPLNPPMPA